MKMEKTYKGVAEYLNSVFEKRRKESTVGYIDGMLQMAEVYMYDGRPEGVEVRTVYGPKDGYVYAGMLWDMDEVLRVAVFLGAKMQTRVAENGSAAVVIRFYEED